jgi:diguanylate cyclase (GGDEF)-like protein/putative nucleotidyltransferase with HDIG domain
MNVYALIALIATVAYIPLFVILLSNRPWNRKQKFFFLFLIPAILWSLAGWFGRSGFFIEEQTVVVKFVVCTIVWALVQLHYFASSFYRLERIKIPLAYLFLIATIALTALGYIPQSVESTVGGTIIVDYGIWTVVVGLIFLFTIGVKDVYSLLKRYRISSDVLERNQIMYLVTAIIVLIVFLLSSFTPRGGEYPIGHIGNLATACILTYAVVNRRLLDIRVVFRQAVVNLVLYGSGIGLVLLFFWLAYRSVGFELSLASLVVTITLGIPAILLFVYKVGAPWRAKIEEAFIGERYHYRRLLSQFVTKIYNIRTMEQFGSEFISLLAQSIDCRRACLLLPQVEDGTFITRFIYPPVEDNPIKELKLRPDSPVVTWLKREGTILPARNLAIFPEFQSIWEKENEEIRLAGVEMFVPLTNRGELGAVLAISERRDGKLYTVEDIDLLETITAQVVASMEKEYFHERLQEQDKEINLLNRLTTIVTSSVNIETIFEGFAQELKEVVNVDWATIALVEGDELYFLALSSNIESPWQREERIPLEGTATKLVCRERKSVYEADLTQYHRFWTGENYLQRGIRSIVYLPLSIKDQSIGSLIVGSRRPGAYSDKQVKLLEQVALQIATPIENSQLYARAEQRSRIDELTGLFNRRHFEERLKEEVSRHSRYGNVFSLLMLDLDNFKSYNDIYGHPSGDILLNQVGRIIKSAIRSADQAFRYGGDEFVVILPQTTTNDARIVAERVREGVAKEMEKKKIAVTCSIGLASYPADGVLSGELVTVADTALYFAKRTGGNRLYLSSTILSEPVEYAGISARRNGLSAIYALVSTVETRDPYTYGHSRKVNTYAVALAEAIGLSPEDVSRVSTAALLHDIGKIGVPDKVLNKKGKLSKEDWEAIKSHPRLGANIVGNIPNLVACVSSILHHHERWDGGGYPEGLKGEEISIEARILAIADSFEAMTSSRPYRAALCNEKAIEELRRCAGSQFDPELVEVFIGIIEAGLPETAKVGHSQPGKLPSSEPNTM